MKKILHISKYYYPYAGGIEDVCYNIINILKTESGISQRIFCFNDKNETVNELYEDVEITRVAVNRIIASQPISFCFYKELKRVMAEFKPDTVTLHVPNPFAAYHLLRVMHKETKLIVYWHSDIVAQSILYNVIKPIETRLLSRANCIVTTSPTYIEYSKPLLSVKEKVVVIPNTINPNKFCLTTEQMAEISVIKESYGNKPIVLFVGRHVKYKGLEFLIQATKYIHNDCKILIGGKGPLTDDLKLAAKNIANIEFLGRIDDDKLAVFYHAADIFAFPSITKNEAFGVVLAEAMYCSTPAITFEIVGSGVNWVSLDQQTGIECPNSDPVKFGEAINMLLSNSSLRESLGCNAKKRVNDLFVIDQIRDVVIEIHS